MAHGKVIQGVSSCNAVKGGCWISGMDARTGKELWSVSPGFNVSDIAVSYRGTSGKQYVVISGPRLVAYALP